MSLTYVILLQKKVPAEVFDLDTCIVTGVQVEDTMVYTIWFIDVQPLRNFWMTNVRIYVRSGQENLPVEIVHTDPSMKLMHVRVAIRLAKNIFLRIDRTTSHQCTWIIHTYTTKKSVYMNMLDIYNVYTNYVSLI